MSFMISAVKIRKCLPATFSPVKRLHVLSFCATDIDDSINQRAEIQSLLDERRTPDGNVGVRLWSRDCDGTECTYNFKIEATLQAYYAEYQRIADGAEGPFRINIVAN